MDIDKAEKHIFDILEKGLPDSFHYHSVAHVRDVLNSAENIAGREGVSGDDLIMLKTAAMFHDAGFIVQSNEHEAMSCDFAMKILPNYNYSTEQIEKICSMIMATKIPQSARNKLEQIICDADLEYLGRDDYWEISRYLFKELSESSKMSEIDWLKIQINFFEQHQYFTESVIALRNEKKAMHLAELKKMLNMKSL